LAQVREANVMEYDQNLPQEFGHQPKRPGASAAFFAVALAAVFLLFALLALPRGETTVAGPAGEKLMISSTVQTPFRGK
jgi:hypothetical protein